MDSTIVVHSAYPEVVPSVDIPLDHVSVTLGKVRLEAVLLTNIRTFLIAGLLMLLIMTVRGIELVIEISQTL